MINEIYTPKESTEQLLADLLSKTETNDQTLGFPTYTYFVPIIYNPEKDYLYLNNFSFKDIVNESLQPGSWIRTNYRSVSDVL